MIFLKKNFLHESVIVKVNSLANCSIIKVAIFLFIGLVASSQILMVIVLKKEEIPIKQVSLQTL